MREAHQRTLRAQGPDPRPRAFREAQGRRTAGAADDLDVGELEPFAQQLDRRAPRSRAASRRSGSDLARANASSRSLQADASRASSAAASAMSTTWNARATTPWSSSIDRTV